MASALYPSFKAKLLTAGLNLASLTIKAVLIDSADYTYSSAHDFLNDVAAGAREGTPQTLGSKTTALGVFDAGDLTFPAVTGDPVEAIVIWNDTGNEATSDLIAFIDGISVSPNGGDINVVWSGSGIFAL